VLIFAFKSPDLESNCSHLMDADQMLNILMQSLKSGEISWMGDSELHTNSYRSVCAVSDP
jgi:hypothetical protein